VGDVQNANIAAEDKRQTDAMLKAAGMTPARRRRKN